MNYGEKSADVFSHAGDGKKSGSLTNPTPLKPKYPGCGCILNRPGSLEKTMKHRSLERNKRMKPPTRWIETPTGVIKNPEDPN